MNKPNVKPISQDGNFRTDKMGFKKKIVTESTKDLFKGIKEGELLDFTFYVRSNNYTKHYVTESWKEQIKFSPTMVSNGRFDYFYFKRINSTVSNRSET